MRRRWLRRRERLRCAASDQVGGRAERVLLEGLAGLDEPGDVVAFHFRTLHAAPGTGGHPHRRRVVSFRYVGDDVRFATRPWTTSPPFPANGLVDGDELDEERFPLVSLS